MFKKAYRLPFSKRFSHTSLVHTDLFIFKFQKNNLLYNRYGFVVGKRIDKRAIVRNSIKRTFRAHIEELHKAMAQGYDVLFVLKKNTLDEQGQVRKLIEATLRKQGML